MGDDDDFDRSAITQRLMTAEEVYVYKIPPLKTSGGHRAEEWNLSKPLQTCSLVVERRGDSLVLDFMHEGKLFAQGCIDLLQLDAANHNDSSSSNSSELSASLQHWLEPVVDSSRYFVLKIRQQGGSGREAMIGFGFRDREQATDLRECLQHYEKAIRREQAASSLTGSYSIPPLAQGEKIHVHTTSAAKAGKSDSGKQGGGGGAVPLLRKPPPPAHDQEEEEEGAAAVADDEEMTKKVEKMSIQMDGVDLNAAKPSGAEDADDSDGAVYEGDEEQWASEFVMK